MQADTRDTRPTPSARLESLAALAGLLERLERQPRSASAEQYQGLVRQVDQLLADAPPGRQLDTLLKASPALATLYENQHYAHAGLCRAPLERALPAELAARELIDRLRQAA